MNSRTAYLCRFYLTHSHKHTLSLVYILTHTHTIVSCIGYIRLVLWRTHTERNLYQIVDSSTKSGLNKKPDFCLVLTILKTWQWVSLSKVMMRNQLVNLINKGKGLTYITRHLYWQCGGVQLFRVFILLTPVEGLVILLLPSERNHIVLFL